MKSRIIIMLASIMLLIAVLVPTLYLNEGNELHLTAKIQYDGTIEEVKSWRSDKGNYYVFLPGEVDFAEMELYSDRPIAIESDTDWDMHYDGLQQFQMNTPYAIFYHSRRGTKTAQITFMQSANVGTMYIETASGGLDYIHQDKENAEEAELRLYRTDGTLDYRSERVDLKGRGNFTWDEYEKKAYGITLVQPTSLLNLGSAERWVLLANAGDLSNLRNKLVFEFSKRLGMAYSPDSEWIDLYINGEYRGLYLLSERCEVHEERVDLDNENAFLVSLEPKQRMIKQNIPHVTMESGQCFRIHYLNDMTEQGIDELEQTWQQLEYVLRNANDESTDQYSKLEQLIDIDSWARKYLIEEIFANSDGGLYSQFFYRLSENGPIFAGPVWDYDHAVGGPDTYSNTMVNKFVVNQQWAADNSETPWYCFLYCNDKFYARVVELYKTEFAPLLTDFVVEELPVYCQRIQQASLMNQMRWSEAERAFSGNDLSDYLLRRLEFLNRIWLKNEDYAVVKVNDSASFYYTYYVIEKGNNLNQLSDPEDRQDSIFQGWVDCLTGEPFDRAQPIYEDAEICGMWTKTAEAECRKLVKLIPLFGMALAGFVLICVEIHRVCKGRSSACR